MDEPPRRAGGTGASRLAGWIALYERAWRSSGTEMLAELFAENATYSPAPFAERLSGLEQIARFWEREREGPDEDFALSWEPVAVEGEVGVARVQVTYAGPPPRVYRDLWIVSFAADGLCSAFEEWPFFPGQPLISPAAAR